MLAGVVMAHNARHGVKARQAKAGRQKAEIEEKKQGGHQQIARLKAMSRLKCCRKNIFRQAYRILSA